MSLSSSTLSLKFMQRGLARSQPSTPNTNTPTGSSSSQVKLEQENQSTPSKSTISYLSAEVSAASRGDKLIIKNEEEWFMPSSSSSSSSSSSRPKIKNQTIFESSYVPFLSSSSNEYSSHAGPSTFVNSISGNESGTGGGGRMTFGGFGKKEEVSKSQNDNEGIDENEEEDDHEVEHSVKVKKERNVERQVKNQSNKITENSFQRPAISPPPPSSTIKSNKVKSTNLQKPLSIADKMRQTVSSSRNSSPSSSSTSTSTPSMTSALSDESKSIKSKNKKKRNVSERESLNSSSNPDSNPNPSSPLITKKVKIESNFKQDDNAKPMNLDEREKAIKAQKKKDKKKVKQS
ncbi:uncharacterized protein I206_107036 [Kwoniella pini CBS 10737]|uniref:Uncharacterized protein n=1 Tax=Kwoniella pini CBS 10737 TaxID=1296096 RepID=A0A1B9HZI2_9TREE|nr:uncharacterized protein I206_05421 [Kwoniella pini CBS 10737]OCF48641.1 hypothetical protein I206_05421 [Kwoniella pini CBS 10737]